jgi:hypothetical protein
LTDKGLSFYGELEETWRSMAGAVEKVINAEGGENTEGGERREEGEENTEGGERREEGEENTEGGERREEGEGEQPFTVDS